MPGPLDHWPETMPWLMDARERVRRAARRRLMLTTLRLTALFAVAAAGAIWLVQWGMS